jgi:hypothetical protein
MLDNLLDCGDWRPIVATGLATGVSEVIVDHDGTIPAGHDGHARSLLQNPASRLASRFAERSR